MAFAHAHLILHRDLKPDNVMVGDFGEVMVMDWGIAKSLSAFADSSGAGTGPGSPPVPRPDTHPGTIVGTHGFMAPEQARGAGADLDERADVYGLGAIMLALLTRRETPIPAESAAAALAASSIPRPLRSICLRALAARPADRYPTAAALGEDVARYRGGQVVLAHTETALERVARVARVYRTPIVLVLAYMIMRTLVAFMIAR